jgi:hypothetical protein
VRDQNSTRPIPLRDEGHPASLKRQDEPDASKQQGPPTPLAVQLVKKRPPPGGLSALRASRQPILKTLKRDHQILIANCAHARVNRKRLVELFRLLQAGHYANLNSALFDWGCVNGSLSKKLIGAA